MKRRRRLLPNMMYRYHCMKCRRWARFHKKIEEYVRPRKCWYCGSTKFYKVRKRKQRTCECPRYWFPHRFEPGKCGALADVSQSVHEREYFRRRAW